MGIYQLSILSDVIPQQHRKRNMYNETFLIARRLWFTLRTPITSNGREVVLEVQEKTENLGQNCIKMLKTCFIMFASNLSCKATGLNCSNT